MLTEIYIEALLVDEELADQVWEAWIAFGSTTLRDSTDCSAAILSRWLENLVCCLTWSLSRNSINSHFCAIKNTILAIGMIGLAASAVVISDSSAGL